MNTLEKTRWEPFEALLRVKVTQGVPVKTDLVALRNGNAK